MVSTKKVERKKKFFRGTFGTGQVELMDRPSAKGKPTFISKKDAPKQFKKLRGEKPKGTIKGQLPSLNNLKPKTLQKLGRVLSKKEEKPITEEPIKPVKEKRGLVESLLKGPEELEGAIKGTVPIGLPIGIATNAPALFEKAAVASRVIKGATNAQRARITREAYAHEISSKTGNLIPKGTKQTQRAFIGKPATTGVSKVFGKRKFILSQFAHNMKSELSTASLLVKAGFATGIAGIVAASVGTYPFAEFELAEATDKIGIAMFRASQEGDQQKVEELADFLDELLDEDVWEEVISKIPYANVIQNVRKNIKAARKSAETFRNLK